MKQKIILFLVSVLILVLTINSTYAKYVSQVTGKVDNEIARWQILVNNENITSNKSSNLTINPIIDENQNVAAGKIAPTSTGYFDIEIDASNVDVSFSYNITVDNNVDSLIKDLKVVKYSIINPENMDSDNIEKLDIENNSLQQVMRYNNQEENFSFSNFIVRLYFVWDDSDTNEMTDSEDSDVGSGVTEDNDNVSINVNINFEQYIEV